MSKDTGVFVLVLFMQLTPAALASVSSKVRVDFQYITNLKYQAKHSLEIDNYKIFIDQIRIAPKSVLGFQAAILQILRTPDEKTSDQECIAGKYVYRISKNSKTTEVRGCVASLAFGDLNQAFQSLQNK